MPTYKYKAKKGPGETVESTIEAASEKDAIDKISMSGYIPVHIEETRSVSADAVAGADMRHGAPRRLRIRSKQITVFTRQLASLLRSGVPILRALAIIAEQSDSPALKTVMAHMYSEVKEGAPFSSAMGKYPGVFPPLYIAMIRTGEDSGSLPEVMFRIAEYRAKQEALFGKFRMAMVYPTLMVLVGIGTIVFMLTFVLPKLMNIYATMGQSLPLPTRILIATSTFMQTKGWILGAAVIAAIGLIKRQSSTPSGRYALSVFVLRLPVVGGIILKAELSRFSRTMELLLRSGLPILRAISITMPVLGNEVLKQKLGASLKALEQGGSFTSCLKNVPFVPPFMMNLVSVGEESGRIDEALREVADSYEQDTDDALHVANNLLEPVMILVMGLVVGFIVMAMLLPIFEMNVMAR